MADSERTWEYGIEPSIEAPPERVISLAPYVTESLFELGFGDRLIGISSRCTRPFEQVSGLPRLGDPVYPEFETIARMYPDLVIADPLFSTEVVIARLREMGLPTWAPSPSSVSDAIDMLWGIMRLFEDNVMIHRVRAIQMALDWTVGSAETSEPVRVFAPLWRDPWITFNRATFAHDLLRVCGGVNVFGDRVREVDELIPNDPLVAGLDKRHPCVSIEDVIAAQPDVILLPGDPYPFGKSDVQVLMGLDMPASQSGRVCLIDGELLTWPGTRLARALQIIPPILR